MVTRSSSTKVIHHSSDPNLMGQADLEKGAAEQMNELAEWPKEHVAELVYGNHGQVYQ
jgi:hypothetical protein